jgi:hypothetical protein
MLRCVAFHLRSGVRSLYTSDSGNPSYLICGVAYALVNESGRGCTRIYRCADLPASAQKTCISAYVIYYHIWLNACPQRYLSIWPMSFSLRALQTHLPRLPSHRIRTYSPYRPITFPLSSSFSFPLSLQFVLLVLLYHMFIRAEQLSLSNFYV